MRYGQIRQYDIANGEGIRTSVFVTGCTHKCPACFNEEYQDFTAGQLWTEETTAEVLRYLSGPEVAGLTLLGGEPMQNVGGLRSLVRRVREEYPLKSVWVYSGYTFEEILADEERLSLLRLCDVLVDGRFVNALRDPALRFRGSSNQRIIDISGSLAAGEVVLHRDIHTGETM